MPLLLLCSVVVCDVYSGLSAIYDDSRARGFVFSPLESHSSMLLEILYPKILSTNVFFGIVNKRPRLLLGLP